MEIGQFMSELFQNQDYGRLVLKHENLPIFETDEFNFYRCLTFNKNFYGKTVSDLHKGNLRPNTPGNRYSNLFPGKKISYWADSPSTARAETKYHNYSSNNLLTFWAYDDLTSTFPTLENKEPLIIIDGRNQDFNLILEKSENGEFLNDKEQNIIKLISEQNPDCLVYESLRKKGGLNYLFFEKGFNKLALREVRLRLGDESGRNTNRIVCAMLSDFSPCLESYGMYFESLAKVKECKEYKKQEEYLRRLEIYNRSMDRMRNAYSIRE